MKSDEQKRILLIEDVVHLARLLEMYLSDHGLTVITANNGTDGLEKFFELPQPDLVLLDLMLPELDGFEVCSIIRKTGPRKRVPIIAISAVYRTDAYRKKMLSELEADAFLTKPFELTELMVLIDKYLGTSLAQLNKPLTDASQTNPEAVRGTIGLDQSFPALLYSLYQKQLTGILFMSQQHISKTIYLSDGVPVFVDSNLKEETLGDLLLKKRKISQEDYDNSLRMMKEEDILQGEALIRMGVLNGVELYNELKDQVLMKIAQCFAWREGNYRFIPDISFIERIPVFDYHPLDILLFGALMAINPCDIENRLRASSGFLVLKPDFFQEWYQSKLDQEKKMLLPLLRSGLPVSVAVESIHKSPQTAPFIGLLLELGHVEIDPGPSQSGDREEKPRIQPDHVTADVCEGAPREKPIIPEATQPSSPSEPVEPAVGGIRTMDRAEEAFLNSYVSLISLDYYSLLDLDRETMIPTSLKQAYFKKAKEYHPDRLPLNCSEDVKKKAQVLFTRINTAYNSLLDPEKRKIYDAELSLKNQEKTERVLFSSPEKEKAEKVFKQGKKFLAAGDLDKALKAFEIITRLDSTDAIYACWHGWAKFQNYLREGESKELQDAIESIQYALSIDPDIERAYFFLGTIFNHKGDLDKAELHLKKALKSKGDAKDTLHELDLVRKKRREALAAQSKKGVFDKWFRKKN